MSTFLSHNVNFIFKFEPTLESPKKKTNSATQNYLGFGLIKKVLVRID